jgi:hypothetical protein
VLLIFKFCAKIQYFLYLEHVTQLRRGDKDALVYPQADDSRLGVSRHHRVPSLLHQRLFVIGEDGIIGSPTERRHAVEN